MSTLFRSVETRAKNRVDMSDDEDVDTSQEQCRFILDVIRRNIIRQQYQEDVDHGLIQQPPTKLSYHDFKGDFNWFAEDVAEMVAEMLFPEEFVGPDSTRRSRDQHNKVYITDTPSSEDMMVICTKCIRFPSRFREEDVKEFVYDWLGIYMTHLKSIVRPIRIKRHERRFQEYLHEDNVLELEAGFKEL